MSLAVANRYAKALADAVLAPNSGADAGRTLEQLRDFADSIAANKDLETVLASPAVPAARKQAVVTQLAGSMNLDRLAMNFLKVVVDHRRIGLLRTMVSSFETTVNERLGRVRAEVQSAAALPDNERTAVVAELSRLTGKQVQASFEVQPELIGGVVARIGSTVYDGSVRGQLDGLRRKMQAR